ncbi:MAG: HDOD domain-containing protein [Nitrospina sp.]|jgi:putative nucleotidyltransferase with HDIG domain|nr:HDOD domain-containing protein [Nitrospina sp.]MBT3876712.1 HDOD domain-containing protein [Nitrospina sp.]MBT4047839.1 HDOD domain-containing protein [Nitrospina sp.]MBT4558600.1 HDOD domain-containing protein [Nitrospina sp.]MBT5349295.1 HDOD domain-containing protein [Nitrospina sp.]
MTKTGKLRILFVDDEIVMLQSLARSLRIMHKEWDCEYVSSGKEALSVLSHESYDLVVSDMRMPEMDGAELLTQVKHLYPETMRFVLSGQAEERVFLRSLGSMHQFLAKPCDFEVLKGSINRGLSLRNYLHSNKEIKKLLLEVDSLPSLPDLYCELMNELESADSSLERIGDIISRDVGMTSKILQVANSGFFGYSQKVSSPLHAVQILGMDLIQNLVLTYEVFSKLGDFKSGKLIFDRIWKHSIDVAGTSMLLARDEGVDAEIENFAFTAGLLHEIGKIILLINFPEKFKEFLEVKLRNRDRSNHEMEEEVFGFSHAKIGAHLVGLWGLPDPIVEAILFHETPAECTSSTPSPLTFVHVANAFEEEMLKEGDLNVPFKIDQGYLRMVGLHHRIPKWIEQYQGTYGDIDLDKL